MSARDSLSQADPLFSLLEFSDDMRLLSEGTEARVLEVRAACDEDLAYQRATALRAHCRAILTKAHEAHQLAERVQTLRLNACRKARFARGENPDGDYQPIPGKGA